MRKGHRRTQSAFTTISNSEHLDHSEREANSNEILKLIHASEIKVEAKVVNYERLEINTSQENNYLQFGSLTLEKANASPLRKNLMAKKIFQHELNCVPEGNKSSEISSQKRSIGGHNQDEDFLPIPAKRRKQKRASDFKRLEIERNEKEVRENCGQGKSGQSLTKPQR